MAEFHLALAPVSGDMHGAPVINVISSTKATVQDSASFSCDTWDYNEVEHKNTQYFNTTINCSRAAGSFG